LNVAESLRHPKLGICGWHDTAVLASMHVKEATMHIYDLRVTNQDKIRLARKALFVKAVPIAHTMNYRSHQYLWLGVAIANARHIETTLCWSQNISHRSRLYPLSTIDCS
jgi:hypothetical protein